LELEAIYSLKPLYAMLASVIGVLLIGLSWEKPNLREFWTILAAVIKFAIVISMVPVVLAGGTLEVSLLTVVPGLDIAFRVDALGMVIGVAFSANMFTLFLCYEAITLCTFPLVGHKQTAVARRGARMYMTPSSSLRYS